MEYISSSPFNPTTDILWYGVKGMQWGVRRYQNKDGSLTTAGKKRYAKAIRNAYASPDHANVGKAIAEDIVNRKGVLGFMEKDIEAVATAKSRWDQAYAKYEEFRASPERAKARSDAYDECLAWYKQNEPEDLATMIKNNHGSEKGLDKFHDFDTMLDGYIDDHMPAAEAAWSKAHGYDLSRVDTALRQYMVACTNATDSLLGKYGQMRAISYTNDRGTHTTTQVRTLVDDALMVLYNTPLNDLTRTD